MAFRKPSVHVVGLKEFTRDIKALGDDAVNELKQAHDAAAKMVAEAAKPLAPRHGSVSVASGKPYWERPTTRNNYRHFSGKLAGDIRHSGTQRGGFVRAGRKDIPWAGPVHFGWPSRPDPAKRWAGGPIRPNPFIYDALDKRRGEVADAFSRYIQKIADRHFD